jgi:hypothetical protein
VHLDDRPVKGGQCVVKSPRIVGQGSGIDDDALNTPTSLVDPVDDLTLVIRLKRLQVETEGLGVSLGLSDVVVEGRRSVDLGFALAEKIEIGSMDEEDGGHLVKLPEVDRSLGEE